LSAGCAAGVDDEEAAVEDDEAVGEAEQQLGMGDPSYDTTLPHTCSWVLTCGGVTAKMRWGRSGADCWSTAPSNMPLVMILHGNGNGFEYDQYAYLQAHLARNGFVSASINVVADPANETAHQQTAQSAVDYLRSACFQSNFVNHFSVPSPVDKQHFGIVGHSRGGETARYVAALLSGAADFEVRAVVAMAPGRATEQDILGTQSEGYLLLHIRYDKDVGFKPFFAHDQAGDNDWSTPSGFDLYRSMKLFTEGTHADFSDAGANAALRSTAKGYVHAYLRAHLASDWGYYEDYIRGDVDPPGDFASDVFSQYSDPTARRVIDNGERANLFPSTIGDFVSTFGLGSITLADGLALDTPHHTRLLVVSPNGTNGFVRWAIPASKRDVTSFKYLSLRLGQLSGATGTDIQIGLTNSGVKTYVTLSDYGAIPQPQLMCGLGNGLVCFSNKVLAQMRTFRIPLWELGATNDVTSVEIKFAGTTGNGRSFIVDSVEFSEAAILQ
jgi:dienelactone hydrolase